jgi:hypothetical protein
MVPSKHKTYLVIIGFSLGVIFSGFIGKMFRLFLNFKSEQRFLTFKFIFIII